MAERIPPPIPTAKGVRSAADPILSEQIDRSAAQIPELKLPQHVALSKPDEISYESLVSREDESVRGLLRSVRDFGAVGISDHGIPTEELRFALGNYSDRIFTVEYRTSYGDHEQIEWGGDDRRIAEEAAAAIGEQNYQIFRQKMDNAAIKLEAIAKELADVIAQSGINQYHETIKFGESKFSIQRYNRTNRNSSSVSSETRQESEPYALSLHLFLESGEFRLKHDLSLVSFETKPESLIVTTGKQIEEWSVGEIKSAEGKFMVKPLLHTSKASLSLRQKWTISKSKSDKAISLSEQILILLVIALLYKFVSYIFS
ncbi:uncharacterized protein LOC131020089 [Salvia miltiorrhiza]|uniref:uncharacterized protein LOC131020089 n=1 Tax=Salvia miltiorrhiza TaxID=226208 RepID=UPI0025AC8D4E|nr:uncharacterized protein LOC131020089 [Salvia miltiorrhiza]